MPSTTEKRNGSPAQVDRHTSLVPRGAVTRTLHSRRLPPYFPRAAEHFRLPETHVDFTPVKNTQLTHSLTLSDETGALGGHVDETVSD